MELLLKYVTGRNLLLLLLCGLAWRALVDNQEHLRRWYAQRWYPPQGRASALGNEISAENERRQASRVMTLHRRVRAQTDQARAQGFDVSALERKADVALTLNVPAYRRRAIALLGEVEMAIPRRRARSATLAKANSASDIIPDARGASASKTTRRRR